MQYPLILASNSYATRRGFSAEVQNFIGTSRFPEVSWILFIVLFSSSSIVATVFDTEELRKNHNYSCLLCNLSSGQGPGTFDASFGPNGTVVTALGGNDFEGASDSVVQPDGKIVIVGRKTPYSSGGSSVVARYNSDGSIDTGFGFRGIVLVNVGVSNALNSVALQPDGSIVAVGWAANAVSPTSALDIFVLRLQADGTFDGSFNGTGKVYTDISDSDEGRVVKIQSDGKLIVGGFATTNSYKDYAFARYNSDGSLDQSFGTDGKVKISANSFSGDDIVFDVLLQPDARIIGIGSTSGIGPSNSVMGLLRLNSDGSLDLGFGNSGFVKTSFTGSAVARSGSLLQDGRIVAAGYAESFSASYAAARYLPDGTLDASFGDGGRVSTSVSDQGGAYDSLVQPDGKLVLAGFSRPSSYAFTLTRYNFDGSLDLSFGNQGIAHGFPGTFDDRGATVSITEGGKLIVAGSSGQLLSDRDIGLVQFSNDGMVDRAFGQSGRVFTSISNNADTAFDVKTQSDGKILVAGTTRGTSGGENLAVIRYEKMGKVDTTFGSGGRVVIQIGSSIEGTARINLRSDGKIVVAGYGQVNDQFRIVVARLNNNGSFDSTFGTNGRLTLGVGSIAEGLLFSDLALQNDGKIVLGCLGTVNGSFDFVLIRLNSNGSADTAFGTGGKLTLSLSSGDDRLHTIAIQSDGKILAGGSVSHQFGESRVGMARFNGDGTLDTTFGMNGTTIPTQTKLNMEARAIMVQTDGKIIAAGGSHSNFAAIRLQAGGVLDSDFGSNGLSLVPIPSASLAVVQDIALQKNGKILLAGYSGAASDVDFTVVRLLHNGTLDLPFSVNGIFHPDLGDVGESLYGVAVQGDGDILLSGGINEYARRTFALLRLHGDSTKAPFDFDGDGKTDVSVFRAGLGQWWYLRSSDGGNRAFAFGEATDTVVPADFTGDGKTDLAFWRPASGEWFVLRSEDSTFFAFPFGAAGDVPSPADFDGDGRSDATVYRPSTNTWFTLRSSDGQVSATPFGTAGDKPVPADYDGDGKADVAIFRPTGGSGGGEWWYLRSSDGANRAFAFGSATDLTVPGDYTGDGKADLAYFRPSTGEWYVLRSEDSSFYAFPWGSAGDIPAPGDYDGDGKIDAAVFRPSNSNWFALRSTAGPLILQFGTSGDRPVPNAFVR